MNIDEMNKRINEVQSKADMEIKHIKGEYALSNSSVKIGDTVTDHIGSVVVKDIKISLGYSVTYIPCCVYYGTELTKQGKPMKRQSGRGVWQRNLIK